MDNPRSRGRLRVIVFGEILWDVFPGESILGGAPLNFAVRLRELGAEPLLVSRLGEDETGRSARSLIAQLGIGLDFVQSDPVLATGTVNVTFSDGQPSYYIVPDAAYDYIEPGQRLNSLAAGADCIYFGTLAQRSPASARTLIGLLDSAPNAIKFLDLNLRRDCWTRESIDRSLCRADIVKLNDDEARTIAALLDAAPSGASPSEVALAITRRWDLKACVVTLGPEGALAASPDGDVVQASGVPVSVADTVGAGDAFSAGFIEAWLTGGSVLSAIRRGNALGSLAAARRGGTTPIRPDELAAMLKGDE